MLRHHSTTGDEHAHIAVALFAEHQRTTRTRTGPNNATKNRPPAGIILVRSGCTAVTIEQATVLHDGIPVHNVVGLTQDVGVRNDSKEQNGCSAFELSSHNLSSGNFSADSMLRMIQPSPGRLLYFPAGCIDG
jgi:hypothetical protein